jgi:hypothetical protein
MNYVSIASTCLVAMFLQGCANGLYEGGLSWKDGWRKGQIIAVGAGMSFEKKLDANCRVSTSDPPADSLYVTIQYRVNGRAVWRTVVAPGGAPWKVNDLVYVNASHCAGPVHRNPS